MTYMKLHNVIKKIGYPKGAYSMSEDGDNNAHVECLDLNDLNKKLQSVGVNSSIVDHFGVFHFILPYKYIKVKLERRIVNEKVK